MNVDFQMDFCRPLTLTVILVLHSFSQNAVADDAPPPAPLTAGGPFTAQEELALDDAQQKEFGLFKKLVKSLIKTDYMKADIYLVKVFRTAGFDRVKAKDYLIDILKFRQEWKVDEAATEDWSSMSLDYYIDMNLNHDREGRPITVVYSGKWDVGKVIMSGQLDSLRRYCYRKFDEMTNLTLAKIDKGVSRFFYIGDLYGFDVYKGGCIACIPFWRDMSVNGDKYWPKMMFKQIFLNSEGGLYTPILNSMKPLMSEEGRANTFAYDTDATKWKEALKPYIKDSQIPKGLHQVEGGASVPSGAASPGAGYPGAATPVAGSPEAVQLQVGVVAIDTKKDYGTYNTYNPNMNTPYMNNPPSQHPMPI